MKKSDVVKALLELGVSQEEIDVLDYNGMRALLKEKQGVILDDEKNDGEEEISPEEQKEQTKEFANENNGKNKDDSNGQGESFFIGEQTIQLRVNERKVIQLNNETNKVVIENIEGGDVYVGVTSITFSEEARLSPKDIKTFSGVTKLFVSSLSRPIISIKCYR